MSSRTYQRGWGVNACREDLRLLAGKPLIAYVAETALRCSALDQVYVNTESPEIAAAATLAGVATYMRDPRICEIASDH